MTLIITGEYFESQSLEAYWIDSYTRTLMKSLIATSQMEMLGADKIEALETISL